MCSNVLKLLHTTTADGAGGEVTLHVSELFDDLCEGEIGLQGM